MYIIKDNSKVINLDLVVEFYKEDLSDEPYIVFYYLAWDKNDNQENTAFRFESVEIRDEAFESIKRAKCNSYKVCQI